eukprot:10206-Heterococcus_DN1.PRE.2
MPFNFLSGSSNGGGSSSGSSRAQGAVPVVALTHLTAPALNTNSGSASGSGSSSSSAVQQSPGVDMECDAPLAPATPAAKAQWRAYHGLQQAPTTWLSTTPAHSAPATATPKTVVQHWGGGSSASNGGSSMQATPVLQQPGGSSSGTAVRAGNGGGSSAFGKRNDALWQGVRNTTAAGSAGVVRFGAPGFSQASFTTPSASAANSGTVFGTPTAAKPAAAPVTVATPALAPAPAPLAGVSPFGASSLFGNASSSSNGIGALKPSALFGTPLPAVAAAAAAVTAVPLASMSFAGPTTFKKLPAVAPKPTVNSFLNIGASATGSAGPGGSSSGAGSSGGSSSGGGSSKGGSSKRSRSGDCCNLHLKETAKCAEAAAQREEVFGKPADNSNKMLEELENIFTAGFGDVATVELAEHAGVQRAAAPAPTPARRQPVVAPP